MEETCEGCISLIARGHCIHPGVIETVNRDIQTFELPTEPFDTSQNLLSRKPSDRPILESCRVQKHTAA